MFKMDSKTILDLSDEDLGCDRLKHLAQELKETQITKLNLKKCNIGNDDVKYLVEALKDSNVTELDLSENEIGCEAAQYLNTMLNNNAVPKIDLDVCYAEGDGEVKKYISQKYISQCTATITLHNNKLGIQGAEYINKTFRNSGIAELKLCSDSLNADDGRYLAEAFKGIKINTLHIFRNHLSNGSYEYLIEAFKGSVIGSLNLDNEKIGFQGNLQHLKEFLRNVRVLNLSLHYNFLKDRGMGCLANVLENSEIRNLNLSKNYINSEGAKFLANILPNSKICNINLCHNKIGVEGAKYLAEGLRNSQVTHIHLHGNMIENEGYQYLADVAEETNISWVNLHDNYLDRELERLENLPRKNSTIASMLPHAFSKLVSFNTESNEFEFIVPKKDAIDIDQYAFIVKTLNNNPNSNVHISHDLDMIDKINEFTATVINKFCSFIENKLPDLIESYGNDADNYVKLVKQFEEMKFHNVVENLLLHRMLYYVDEKQEILHPYIYNLLARYNMPLYSEALEPNKKDEIISYCHEHSEVEGAQEVIDLLESKCFQQTGPDYDKLGPCTKKFKSSTDC